MDDDWFNENIEDISLDAAVSVDGEQVDLLDLIMDPRPNAEEALIDEQDEQERQRKIEWVRVAWQRRDMGVLSC